jgi:hypothetical protein
MFVTSTSKTSVLKKWSVLLATQILVWALAACGENVTQPEVITGVWQIEQEEMAGTLRLNTDNSFAADTSDGTLTGTWKIEGNRLLGTVDESTVPNIAHGYTWSNVIVEISEERMILMNRAGNAENYLRVH